MQFTNYLKRVVKNQSKKYKVVTDKPTCKALCIAFLVMLYLPSSQRTAPATPAISSKKIRKTMKA